MMRVVILSLLMIAVDATVMVRRMRLVLVLNYVSKGSLNVTTVVVA